MRIEQLVAGLRDQTHYLAAGLGCGEPGWSALMGGEAPEVDDLCAGGVDEFEELVGEEGDEGA